MLKSLKQSQYVTKIVAVNDGSTDASLQEARAVPGVTVLDAPHAGKAAAVKRGLDEITSEYVLMIDADLGTFDSSEVDRGIALMGAPLTKVHKKQMKSLSSVASNRVDMVLYFIDQPLLINPDRSNYLSGQRVLSTQDLRAAYAQYQPTGFSLETDINDYMYTHQRGVVWIRVNMTHTLKYAKHGMAKGVAGDMRMISELWQAGAMKKMWQWKKNWGEAKTES